MHHWLVVDRRLMTLKAEGARTLVPGCSTLLPLTPLALLARVDLCVVALCMKGQVAGLVLEECALIVN
jgi:hypothetical protein